MQFIENFFIFIHLFAKLASHYELQLHTKCGVIFDNFDDLCKYIREQISAQNFSNGFKIRVAGGESLAECRCAEGCGRRPAARDAPFLTPGHRHAGGKLDKVE